MPNRRITREDSTAALRGAARALHVPTEELTVPQYRALRSRLEPEERLPSDVSIRLAFGSWKRACESAATLPWQKDLEGAVRDHLYGPQRPARRRRPPQRRGSYRRGS